MNLETHLKQAILREVEGSEYDKEINFTENFEGKDYNIYCNVEVQEDRWDEPRPDWGYETLVEYQVTAINEVCVLDEDDNEININF